MNDILKSACREAIQLPPACANLDNAPAAEVDGDRSRGNRVRQEVPGFREMEDFLVR